MGLLHSVRAMAEMARVTVPTVVEAAIGRLDRQTMDGRTHQFAQRAMKILDVDLRITGGAEVLPDATYVYMSNDQMRTGRTVHVHIGAPIEVAGRTVDTLRAEVDAFLHRHVEGLATKSV